MEKKQIRRRCRCGCGLITTIGRQWQSGHNSKIDNPAKNLPYEFRRWLGELSTKHGKTGTKEYRSWMAMKRRCYYPKNIGYKYYGGRGIRVCIRWRLSFRAFLRDMGKRPSLMHTLDRIKNNENYKPSNCRWATKKQQAQNRRKEFNHGS